VRFKEGNLLISLRNVSTLVVLDQETLEVVWSWGADDLEDQHTPEMLSSGNILVFDNGTRALSRSSRGLGVSHGSIKPTHPRSFLVAGGGRRSDR
jgi:hypothetical protein